MGIERDGDRDREMERDGDRERQDRDRRDRDRYYCHTSFIYFLNKTHNIKEAAYILC
jgi:hypothetical protein